MIKSLLLCCLLCLCVFVDSAWARGFAFGLGSEFRTENNVENQIELKNFNGFFVAGTLFEQDSSWWMWLEQVRFLEKTGNASLAVDRATEHWNIKIKKEKPLTKYINAVLGGGVGIYHERIDTSVGGQVQRDYSDYYFTGAALAGIRANMPWLWISGDVGIEYWQNWKPQPNINFGLRLGIHL